MSELPKNYRDIGMFHPNERPKNNEPEMQRFKTILTAVTKSKSCQGWHFTFADGAIRFKTHIWSLNEDFLEYVFRNFRAYVSRINTSRDYTDGLIVDFSIMDAT